MLYVCKEFVQIKCKHMHKIKHLCTNETTSLFWPIKQEVIILYYMLLYFKYYNKINGIKLYTSEHPWGLANLSNPLDSLNFAKIDELLAEELGGSISSQEVQEAIRFTQNGKSPGHYVFFYFL